MCFIIYLIFDFDFFLITKRIFQDLEKLLEERERRLESLKVIYQLREDMISELSTIKEKYHIISTQRNNKIQSNLEIRHVVTHFLRYICDGN